MADARRSRKAGTKAANLSLLIGARFQVPRGFVVSADAYRSHLWASGVRGLVSSAADAQVRERIRRALLDTDIPGDVWVSIEQAYGRLAFQTGESDPAVCVRASAIEVGAPGGAFAGAYASCRNVSGRGELREAVRRVWASLWSEEASALRTGRCVAGTEPAMAVIVQQMARADWRGQAFTADPKTGDPRRVVISCSPVAGRAAATAEPSFEFSVDLADLSVRPAGGDAGPGGRVIELVAEQAVVAEQHLGGRLEIEWAAEGDRLWILQARVLTGLPAFFPFDDDLPECVRLRRATAHPVSHFAASRARFRTRACGGVRSTARLANGYVYVPRPQAGEAENGPPNRAGRTIAEWERGARREVEACARRVVASVPGSMSRHELMEHLTDAVLNADRAVCLMERLQRDGAGTIESVGTMLEGTGAARLFADLWGGVPDPAVMRDARLQDLGDRFAAAESLGRVDEGGWWRGFKREVEAFARDFGYCFRDTGDAYDPASWRSWIEDDEPVLRMIGAMARRRGRSTVVTLHCAARQDADEAAAEAAKVFRGAARRRFKRRLNLARRWLKAVCEAEQACALALTALRLLMVEAGRRLAESGAIAQTADVWELSLEEILESDGAGVGGELAVRIGARKHLAWLRQRLAAPKHLPSDPIYHVVPSASEGEAVLRGLGVSPGVVIGRARVADSIQEAAEIEDGEILVVRASTPAWTPFMAVAGGLVSEEDCECWSRAALMKDYGIPAVVDCEGVLSAVTQGRKLKVDGSGGVVEL